MNTELPLPPPPASDSQSQKSSCDRKILLTTLRLHWPFLKTELKEQYIILTDEDLNYVEGQEDEFLDHLEKKACLPRLEFETFIVECGNRLP
jgi:transposase-like protein